ncbi:MAG: hypothetical protein IJW59_02570 [Clostridia bacterium]|nr:hypothetical protein [Clostridia bacterium]
MKGKSKKDKRKKIGVAIMLVMSFMLTIVLTATLTLAWFYDTDWASESVTMAGAVGIEMREESGKATSGKGQLHFKLYNTSLAYPGQAIEMEASVFNNGGTSVQNYFTENPDEKPADPAADATPEEVKTAIDAKDAAIKNSGAGSDCYVRAYFEVFTNITEDALKSDDIYEFLVDLIEAQNTKNTYKWVHWENDDAVCELDDKFYYNGSTKIDGVDITDATVQSDGGYFYLCTANLAENSVLYKLEVGDTAAFLWDGQFIIPWQLTNLSADKVIYIGVKFEAIQTFIPKMADGKIVTDADNQLPEGQCTISNPAVQTVFNTCTFEQIEYMDEEGNTITFDGTFNSTKAPATA